MLRTLMCVLLLSVPTMVLAADEPAPKAPQRFLQIRTWRGDALVMEGQIVIGQLGPSVLETTSGGSNVPEGMVPPPRKVKSLICISDLQQQSGSEPNWLENYRDALAYAQRFVVGNTELQLVVADADRFDVVVLSSEPEAKAIEVPAGLHDDFFDQGSGVPIAWFSASLTPLTHDVFIYPAPEPPSVTIKDDGAAVASSGT